MIDAPAGRSFSFAFDPGLLRWARWFGVLPTRSFVTLDARGLEACFGPWRLATPWANVTSIERTGPYRAWKVAGGARLSLSDRGLTFSATAAAGACLRFRRPERGLDPLGILRHPGLTLGVDDLDGFIALARRFMASVPSAPGLDAPTHPRGGFRAAARAVWRWSRREGSVEHHQRMVGHVPPPTSESTDDAQPIEGGTGPGYHRRYRIVVHDTQRSLDEVVGTVAANPSVLTDVAFSPFTKLRGELGTTVVGDRYLVEIAGPWKGAVEVVASDRRCLRMSTLDGHMEAGIVELRFAADSPGQASLTIESWTRSRDRAIDLLYDKFGLARAMQSQMWVTACERFAELVGGVADGPVEVVTERAHHSCPTSRTRSDTEATPTQR
jgi:hypothetical protein